MDISFQESLTPHASDVLSPDAIVFGPNRPIELEDVSFKPLETWEASRRRDEFQRMYLNEIVSAVEASVGNRGQFREPVYSTVR